MSKDRPAQTKQNSQEGEKSQQIEPRVLSPAACGTLNTEERSGRSSQKASPGGGQKRVLKPIGKGRDRKGRTKLLRSGEKKGLKCEHSSDSLREVKGLTRLRRKKHQKRAFLGEQ